MTGGALGMPRALGIWWKIKGTFINREKSHCKADIRVFKGVAFSEAGLPEVLSGVSHHHCRYTDYRYCGSR